MGAALAVVSSLGRPCMQNLTAPPVRAPPGPPSLQVLPCILDGLADEAEGVRDAALSAGRIAVELYANSALRLLLPAVGAARGPGVCAQPCTAMGCLRSSCWLEPRGWPGRRARACLQ